MKQFLTLSMLLGVFLINDLCAQETKTLEQLKAEKSEIAAQIATLQGQAAALQGQINAYPGWKFGGTGIVGLTFSKFNDWFPSDNPQSRQNNFSVALSGFANLDRDKDFWRTNMEWNAGSSKTEITNYNEDGTSFEEEVTAKNDLFNLKSLYGYKLSDKWAISGQGLYTTTILDNFNDPGNLLVGVGATWTPIPNLVAVFHPLAYNFAFSRSENTYESSAGANITVDYTGTLVGRFGWKTQFLSFLSYENPEADDNPTPPLSWWNWTNTVTFNVFKGLGVSANFGLRGNAQETFNYRQNVLQDGLTGADIDNVSADVQTFYTIGLSYTLF